MKGVTPAVNPKVSYWLWVMVMCPCRVISFNKGTTLGSDIDDGRGWGTCGGRGIWEISVFCSEPKTPLKKIVFKNAVSLQHPGGPHVKKGA